ncbi:MAG: glycolate oxidase subunit GlcE [Sedimenticola sp.]|nr:glycolate oxidase subunit GlcE [Sedimenticola sp.]
MKDADIGSQLEQTIAEAAEVEQSLQLVGSGSKQFLGRQAIGKPLAMTAHQGVVNYEPRELVITVRSGTPLAELETLLAAEGQMLPFEPPHFGDQATLGGTIACGLSGPRRPYLGAARDFVLGTTVINGLGRRLRFGGEVMKNVAGYDVSRMMVGAMGTLGVILDVSMKVLPLPESDVTLVQELSEGKAIALMNQLAGRPLPLSAASYDGLNLYLRLSGSEQGVKAACSQVGGEQLPDDAAFWTKVREHQHPFFKTDKPLWRLSISAASPPLDLPGKQLIDWGGAQRWFLAEDPEVDLHAIAASRGGHAQLFRGGDRTGEVTQPLSDGLMLIHQQLKQAFDPKGILNLGRLYRKL